MLAVAMKTPYFQQPFLVQSQDKDSHLLCLVLPASHLGGHTHMDKHIPFLFWELPRSGLNNFLFNPLAFVSGCTVLVLACAAHIFASLESDFAAFDCLANCILFLLAVRPLLSTGFGWDKLTPLFLLGVEHASSGPVIILPAD